MTKKYDLVIVGDGPGGAMAAKTAGENGLKTAILERKTNPAEITRACAMMFAVESGYYFAERMFYNEKNKKMIFPVNGFTVDYDGDPGVQLIVIDWHRKHYFYIGCCNGFIFIKIYSENSKEKNY